MPSAKFIQNSLFFQVQKQKKLCKILSFAWNSFFQLQKQESWEWGRKLVEYQNAKRK
jgi:hypothetical protein